MVSAACNFLVQVKQHVLCWGFGIDDIRMFVLNVFIDKSLTSRVQNSCQAPSCCCKPVAAIGKMNRLSAHKLATPVQCLNSGLLSKQALVVRTLICQLRSVKQIGTSDPNSGVATCQPGMSPINQSINQSKILQSTVVRHLQ